MSTSFLQQVYNQLYRFSILIPVAELAAGIFVFRHLKLNAYLCIALYLQSCSVEQQITLLNEFCRSGFSSVIIIIYNVI